MSLLDTPPQFSEFVDRCSDIDGLDIDKMRAMAAVRVARQQIRGAWRDLLKWDNSLEDHWYESLASGAPDLGVYEQPEYLGDLWACWELYSRTYVRDTRRYGVFENLGPVATVVDLGCGIGYSTGALREVFPDARVIAVDLPGTYQYRVAETMARDFDFELTAELPDCSVDLLWAVEFFEHVYRPIEYLGQVVEKMRPRAFLVANTFGPRSIGHFEEYAVNGHVISAREAGKAWNKKIRDLGYSKVQTKLWNQRPTLYVHA